MKNRADLDLDDTLTNKKTKNENKKQNKKTAREKKKQKQRTTRIMRTGGEKMKLQKYQAMPSDSQ